MPIQFRCAYCSQLLGIARRKAGSVITCPTCGGQVIVPQPRTHGSQKPVAGPHFAELERSDFEALFQPPAPGRLESDPIRDRGEPAIPPQPPRPERPSASAAERLPQAPAGNASAGIDELAMGEAVSLRATAQPQPTVVPSGVVLTRGRLIFFALITALLLALAFTAGMLIGRSPLL